MSVAIAVLAAGASTRLGEPKALAQIGSHTGLGWILRTAARLGSAASGPLTEVIVVTGAHEAEIGGWLAESQSTAGASSPPASRLHLSTIVNSNWKSGRTGGVRLVADANPGKDLLIWPADTPLVAAETIERMIERWVEMGEPAMGWLAPRHRGARAQSVDSGESAIARFGHPIIVGQELLSGLAQFAPDAPLSGLRERARPLAAVDVHDVAILDDLDTPADLYRLRSRL